MKIYFDFKNIDEVKELMTDIIECVVDYMNGEDVIKLKDYLIESTDMLKNILKNVVRTIEIEDIKQDVIKQIKLKNPIDIREEAMLNNSLELFHTALRKKELLK